MSKKRKLVIGIFVLLTVAVVAFIFSNSLLDGEESNAQSGRLAGILRWFLDPGERLSEEEFHYLVRKLAHGVEFMFLGLSLGGLTAALPERVKGVFLGYAICFALLVAVSDEFIQSFTGRTSMVSDVLIDFGGALTGLLVALLGGWMIARKRTKSGDLAKI